MKELQDGAGNLVATPVIDASVHIFVESNKDLRENFLQEPFRSRGFPDYEMDWYGAPGGEYATRTTGPDGQYPGSDPAVVAKHLFTDRGVDLAILHPMTRGIMPDRHLGSALAVGAQRDDGDPLAGPSRVRRTLPRHAAGQSRRHRRRAARDRASTRTTPGSCRLGVPLQSREVYGKPQFWPLWEAAVDAGLPVAVHFEVGSGVALPPTPNGLTRTYEQYVGFTALNYLYHLMNMIAEGVFERWPDAEVRLGRRRRRPADPVHVADGLLRPPAPGADPVGAQDAQRLPARSRVLRAGLPGRAGRRRLRRRVGRIHRQGRHGRCTAPATRTGSSTS